MTDFCSSSSLGNENFQPEIWNTSLSLLERELDPQIFAAFIKPLEFSHYDPEHKEFVLGAPSKFHCNHVQENFSKKICDVVQNASGKHGLQLRIDVVSSLDRGERKKLSPHVVIKKIKQNSGALAARNKAAEKSQLNPRYTFSTFVVGNSNQFCHAASLRVAENPGKSYNPLFIYGGVGLGKTHLLHAIGHAMLESNPRAKVLYMSSETFTNELIQALRFSKMNEFKNRFRTVDLLLVDDIQFMCGKESTQEEFFHTFNALYNAKHQIVLTSDKIPQDIPGIEERLQTRFSWGLTADLQSPDFETRVAILKRRAFQEGFDLPTAVAHFIAEEVSSNIRELEGALTRLHAQSSLQGIPISVDLAKSALAPLLQVRKVHVTVDDIKKAVTEHFPVSVTELVSKRRTKNLAFPRHIAMYLCRKHTSSSFPEIGSQFGGRDHSSVIHAANTIKKKLETDEELQKTISQIEQLLF